MKDMFSDRRSWYKDPADTKKSEENVYKPEEAEAGEELTEDEREAQALLEADLRAAEKLRETGTEDGLETFADENPCAVDGGYMDGSQDTQSGGDDAEAAGGENGDADGDGAEAAGGDSRVLQMYLDELQAIEPVSEKELALLIKKSHDDDLTARNRIVEGHLKYALSILWEYLNKGVELTELISESNMALIGAIDGYDGGDLKAGIDRAVRGAAERLISENGQIHAADEDLAQRVNELSDLSVEMVQELGRKPTNAELAHRLNVSEDVVESLIRMSIDAL